MEYVQKEIEMMERKEFLEKHPYKIWLGKDGYWRTYLPKNDEGRKLIKKKNKEDIEDNIISHYQNFYKEKYLFKNRFEIWKNRQRNCGRSDNTIYRYEQDYNRCIKGDIIEMEDIRKIDEEYISLFFKRLLSRKSIPWRTLKALYGYLNGIFEKSIIDRIIKENPCKYVDLPIFKKLCVEPKRKTKEERTLSDFELKTLQEKLHSNKGNRIAKLAVELSMYTGLRVGELAGLKWECIDFVNKTIIVKYSEKIIQRTREHYISTTKTGKERIVPMTSETERILKEVKKEEIKNGWLGEFVFQNEFGRIHKEVISNCIRHYTGSKDFVNEKSIHALRRTLNSHMRQNGVPISVAASILGHTERVNNENYTYDFSTLEEKQRVLEIAGNFK